MINETLGDSDPSYGQLEAPKSPENDLLQPVILASRGQQEAVFLALFNRLIDATNLEIEGNLKKGKIAQNQILRNVLSQLATNLGKVEEFRPIDWLLVGVTEFVPDELLHEWANPTENIYWTDETLRDRAQYFEQQKKKEGGNKG